MLQHLLRSVVGVSASPELDGVVCGPAVKGLACARSCGFAALTLDSRSSDQGIGWLWREAELWSAEGLKHRGLG
jgi:hypothetical protein